jgi:hypothetical protein
MNMNNYIFYGFDGVMVSDISPTAGLKQSELEMRAPLNYFLFDKLS